MPRQLTLSQLDTIEAVQRMSSVLSILGALFIIVTFLGSPRFHKPINRLAFYAAIANILCTVATTIARAGPAAGRGSALCNMQGLFIQTFLQSDALFIAFMALNVYLTVNRKFSAPQLRKLEPYYVGVSFGLPLISGFVFLFVRAPGKGPVYGDATLWCWISQDYDVLRLATFYAPVWIIILITFILYIAAGKTVFRMRIDLRRFDQRHGHLPTQSTSQTELSSCAAPSGRSPMSAIQMTTVTHVDHVEKPEPIGCTYLAGENEPYKYTVTIEATSRERQGHIRDHENEFEAESIADIEQAPSDRDGEEYLVQGHGRSHSVGSATTSDSSTKKPSLTATETATAVPAVAPSANRRALAANRKTMRANAAAWAYTRCAFLFFIGLIITWVPSSTNRVYALIHPERQEFALYLAASLVLPAQGLWNFIIYLVTSWASCKLMWRDISLHIGPRFLKKKPSIESIPRDRIKIGSR
ncbi:hypothetical protein TWF730_005467 [Orbilia blumenaviensis]|uniref:G-protein coupled receptors family 2 profile 2 domain-containing protein n=1 Tax=Orbilia blumenaviensis TaxID=1796055 RepID=A0AAV9VJU6_9PEZI